MSLFAIGDLHLSLGSEKPMDVFGGRWQDYVDKIREGFHSVVTDEDWTVLCGDISWGMSLEESLPDFQFINELPGKKIILKGNHDYWWSTAKKTDRFFAENGLDTISILHNNSFVYEDRYAICGTRGWFYEEEADPHHEKILKRECIRLEASINSGGEMEKIVFLHYPPKYSAYECAEILEILKKHSIRHCYYGHIHSKACSSAFNGEYNGTMFRLISADYLNFVPFKVL